METAPIITSGHRSCHRPPTPVPPMMDDRIPSSVYVAGENRAAARSGAGRTATS
jgi:hypothetical protein